MTEITGTKNQVLFVDLTHENFSIVTITEQERTMYLGGKGLGLKLLFDRIKPGINPLSPENIVAFMTGVLAGTGLPCSDRFSAVTKSPLTGIMVSSSCGGSFGMALKTSGWDGLLITGRSKQTTYLYIHSKGVDFRNASHLWGLDTQETQTKLNPEGSGSIVIGPAGENLLKYANVCSGKRYFGRGGIGAVLGSKNLKAIVSKGKEYKIVPKSPEKFKKYRTRLIKYINRNKVTSNWYRNYGTLAHINLSNREGILPVRNFTMGSHQDAHKVSGELINKTYKTSHSTCKPCSILCGHKGTFAGKVQQVPEYETIGLLGPNLVIFDPVKISEWNETCGLMGMDTISAGGTLAWAMEASEKGLFESNLKFGSSDEISSILKDIAYNRGTGKELALGSRILSKKYGGQDFAIQVKGLELAAYDPRGCFGHGLSYAVGNRGGCHLSAALWGLETYFHLANPFTIMGKHIMVKFFENIFSAVNSLHICQFTAYPIFLEPALVKYTPMPVLKILIKNATSLALGLMDISLWPKLWSAVIGKKLSVGDFKRAGERIHILERYMNTKEGISKKDDTLPDRLLSEARKNDSRGMTVPLSEMLDKYYGIRGYDANGIPQKTTLNRLGIKTKVLI